MLSQQRGPTLYQEPRLPVWWEWTVVGMTILSILLLLSDLVFEAEDHASIWIVVLDTLICAAFVVDFGVRLMRTKRRWIFLRRNWIDLLGAIPMINELRVLRVVRIIRLARLAALTRRLAVRFRITFLTESLGYVGLVAVIIWISAAFFFFFFEHGHNGKVRELDDALWWSMTTLSTVGYGDLYPETSGGRLVALVTMVLGVGVLGTLAATIAAALLDIRERGRKGLRSYRMRNHLLVLGWNARSLAAIDDFRHDPRFEGTDVVIVAELEEAPIEDPVIRFVRGSPGRAEVLERASAASAEVAIIFSGDPKDPRSDHESALIALTLRASNPRVRISAELVDPSHREYLVRAGCDSVVDMQAVASTLLVRSVQDVGISDVVEELLSNKYGSEIYRVEVPEEFWGKAYREYATAMLEKNTSVIGLERRRERRLNPDAALLLREGDEAFVVARDVPED